MNKSKKLYIAVLIMLFGIALLDHIQPKQDAKQIVIGTQKVPKPIFHFAFLTK